MIRVAEFFAALFSIFHRESRLRAALPRKREHIIELC